MVMEYKTRKNIRLGEYDYSQNGAYFVTFCTKNRKKLLWKDVGMRIAHPHRKYGLLSSYGTVVQTAIQNITKHYPCVFVDNYAIMPNHVHILLRIDANPTTPNGCAMRIPTIPTVVNQLKGYVTKQIGFSCWQARFYDHVVRNKADYDEIWTYIENNPQQWELDELYEV